MVPRDTTAIQVPRTRSLCQEKGRAGTMGLCRGARGRVGCWVSRHSRRPTYVPGGRRATRTLELQRFHLRGPWQALGFYFF